MFYIRTHKDSGRLLFREGNFYIFASKKDEVTYIKNARNLKQHVKNLTLYKELEDLSHGELLFDKEVVKYINEVVK